MKKFLVMILMVGLLFGCTGLNVSTPINVATDAAFVLAIQNNPSYKPVIVATLIEVKAILSNEKLTYDQLLVAISEKFGGKYAVIGIIFSGYLAEDKPIFETYLPMLDSYKAAIIKKIDRFILLASM